MADLALGTRLSYPPLTPAQKTGLRAALGPKVALANPLDYHTYIWGDEAAITRAFTAAADPGLDMLCVVLDFPRADRCTSPEWQHVVHGLRAAGDATGVKVALIGSLPENLPEDEARRALDLGIVPFCGMDEALAAMSAAVMPDDTARPAPLLATVPADPHLLTEAEAKSALAAFGLTVPRSLRATSAEDAGAQADRIGFPVVLKGEGFAHKTEAGAVAVGLIDRAAATAAAGAMPATTFLVEEQVTGAVAELLVGVVCDPACGYVLTLGAGGHADRASARPGLASAAGRRGRTSGRRCRVCGSRRSLTAIAASPVPTSTPLSPPSLPCRLTSPHTGARSPRSRSTPCSVRRSARWRWTHSSRRETRHDRRTDPHRTAGRRARSHARPAQGQCHRPGHQPDHGTGLHRFPRRSRPARGDRHRGGREVLLPGLGPQGGGRRRRGRRRLRRGRLRRACRNCAGSTSPSSWP